MSEEEINPDTFTNSVLTALEPDAQMYLRERSQVRPMSPGDVIYSDEVAISHVVFPHEGVISVVAGLDSGRSVETCSVGPEGFIGVSHLLGRKTALGKSIVQIEGHASWVTIADLEAAMQIFPSVRVVMLGYAKTHTEQLMESVACNSLHTAEQRVSRWLLHAHDRVSGDTYKITQDAIASLLALRRATVNAVCTDLMNSGAITYQRGSLTIVDRDLLHKRACACYDRIKRTGLR